MYWATLKIVERLLSILHSYIAWYSFSRFVSMMNECVNPQHRRFAIVVMQQKMQHQILILYIWLVNAGGLAEEVDEKVLHSLLVPFGEIVDVQIPMDYTTGKLCNGINLQVSACLLLPTVLLTLIISFSTSLEKNRGFGFVEFELAEVICDRHDSILVKRIVIIQFIHQYYIIDRSILVGNTIIPCSFQTNNKIKYIRAQINKPCF